tara:strand:- start:630 stop:1370 length:741 start_codon:yes stop_codon:yes gene_type:complete
MSVSVLLARLLLALSSVGASPVVYRTTRGGQSGVSFGEAVLQGLGTDRGLFVPERIPTFDAATLESWRGKAFESVAFEVLSLWIDESEIPPDTLKSIVDRAYATFRAPEVTPVRPLPDGLHILELFHGPTFAFKDVALQFLGNLFEYLLAQRDDGKTITVVGATSGDTGSSAIHGLRGKDSIDVFILYPDGRTSPVQERQMVTVMDQNVHTAAIEGTFDDCQVFFSNPFSPYVTPHFSYVSPAFFC